MPLLAPNDGDINKFWGPADIVHPPHCSCSVKKKKTSCPLVSKQTM